MTRSQDIIIGVDAGTSVIKAVAFDLNGEQLACSAVANNYQSAADGAVTQSMPQTWSDCVAAIRGLTTRVDRLATRTAALAVTGQGDGTWLVGEDDQPVGDAWLWLDARAAPTVQRLRTGPLEARRFEKTGTGLNTCQQGAQLAHLARHQPSRLARAETALHCKDWLYLCLTGVRATDPSEASFTFGDFRTRRYDADVITALGLDDHQRLLPEIVDGTHTTHALTQDAAAATGLLAGTPVSLGYVDMVMTGLGAGVHTGDTAAACSIVGSTGVHMRAVRAEAVKLNDQRTGYVMALPVPGMVTQTQTNMSATLNIDWLLGLAAELIQSTGTAITPEQLMPRLDDWLARSRPGSLIYHPYISRAGERGPFVDANARASFIGLSTRDGFADLVRAVVDGLGMATLDCYSAMGPLPTELRLSGGAARSRAFREVISAAVGAKVRVSGREEAGAAGAAMMAAVAIGAFDSMADCIDTWVAPLLGQAEAPDEALHRDYAELFRTYQQSRRALEPLWPRFAE